MREEARFTATKEIGVVRVDVDEKMRDYEVLRNPIIRGEYNHYSRSKLFSVSQVPIDYYAVASALAGHPAQQEMHSRFGKKLSPELSNSYLGLFMSEGIYDFEWRLGDGRCWVEMRDPRIGGDICISRPFARASVSVDDYKDTASAIRACVSALGTFFSGDFDHECKCLFDPLEKAYADAEKAAIADCIGIDEHEVAMSEVAYDLMSDAMCVRLPDGSKHEVPCFFLREAREKARRAA